MRNLRIVRLSIFSKLLTGLDLRIGFRVRVLPEEPFFPWSNKGHVRLLNGNRCVLQAGHFAF